MRSAAKEPTAVIQTRLFGAKGCNETPRGRAEWPHGPDKQKGVGAQPSRTANEGQPRWTGLGGRREHAFIHRRVPKAEHPTAKLPKHPPRVDVPWDIHEVHPGLSPKVFQGDLPRESPNSAPQVVKISKEKLG